MVFQPHLFKCRAIRILVGLHVLGFLRRDLLMHLMQDPKYNWMGGEKPVNPGFICWEGGSNAWIALSNGEMIQWSLQNMVV